MKNNYEYFFIGEMTFEQKIIEVKKTLFILSHRNRFLNGALKMIYSMKRMLLINFIASMK